MTRFRPVSLHYFLLIFSEWCTSSAAFEADWPRLMPACALQLCQAKVIFAEASSLGWTWSAVATETTQACDALQTMLFDPNFLTTGKLTVTVPVASAVPVLIPG